ncbi:MAG TPA: family 20 glycosylhydrolase [Gemmatimonadales bacterium]
MAALLLTIACTGCAGNTTTGSVTPLPDRYPIIPMPRSLQAAPGRFQLDQSTRVVLSDPASVDLRSMVELLLAPLRSASGLLLTIVPDAHDDMPNTMVFRLTSGGDSQAESYRLVATERGVVLSAATPAGLFRGVQTLRQLLPPDIERTVRAQPLASVLWSIPAVTIEDAPHFRYRGVLLDVARWYYPPDFIRKVIDLLALYKFNALHLHLTDDQGWRLEIRKYPLLTRIGAWRKETILGQHFDPYVGDGRPHGGFYTQEEIRDLVAYAARRDITIIPEIEMPGHAGAALAAYPELSCTGGPFEVSTTWGMHQDIYCPSEQTFGFLEDVLLEVMQLFPGKYIHIGGDEVPKDQWKASPIAQEVIRREGLANEEELQSYFIRRIEAYLVAHGRRLIGWDEILEGGLAPEATVMSWRGVAGGIEAARQGHDVIMTPSDHAYLDYYQGDPANEPLAIGGFVPLDTVYAFEPVPHDLAPNEAAHVIGGQGSLWTEYIPTPAKAEYMLLPRLLALSETLWSPRETRNWDQFRARLPLHFTRLDALGFEYRVPEPTGLGWDSLQLQDRFRVAMRSPIPGGLIRFTTDGSDPTSDSPVYSAPLDLRVTPEPLTVSARLFLPNGRVSPVARGRITQATWHQPVALRSERRHPGLAYEYFEAEFRSSDQINGAIPTRTGTVTDLGLRGDERAENYGVKLAGLLCVPKDEFYTFYLSSDDGAKLRIAGTLVVDRDGPQSASEKPGQIALRAGCHPLEVRFFQATGAAQLHLEVSAPGRRKGPVPRQWYSHLF